MSSEGGGDLYIISAPLGAGKTSLISSLLQRHPELALSVSDTTRPAREGEVDGQHYHFLDPEDFRAGIDRGDYLEHAEVFGNFYGTRREQVAAFWAAGRPVLLEIDVQGADQVRRSLEDTCAIFVLPPSPEALRERLEKRGKDTPEVIQRRLDEARGEMSAWPRFDFLVINDDFEKALDELSSILTAWPLRTNRQSIRQAQRLDQFTRG